MIFLQFIQKSLTTEPLLLSPPTISSANNNDRNGDTPSGLNHHHPSLQIYSSENQGLIKFGPQEWKSIVLEFILLPLISYNYTYPFPVIDFYEIGSTKSLNKSLNFSDSSDNSRPSIYHTKVWMADGLRLLLTPEGAQASLGISEVLVILFFSMNSFYQNSFYEHSFYENSCI